MKKAILLCLCLVLLLAAVPLTALSVSAATRHTEGLYVYTVTDGMATIVGVDDSISGEVVIPTMLGGYPVVTIGQAAFIDTNITAVTVPEGITTIQAHAFSGCPKLERAILSEAEGLTRISPSLFNYCVHLKQVDLPDSVTTIAGSAFEECYDLETLQLPKNLVTIGKWAFSHCASLKEVVIPEGVTTIGEQAFYFCERLTSITLPASLTEVRADSFDMCINLSDVSYTGTQADKYRLGKFSGNLGKATWNCAKSPVELIWDPPDISVRKDHEITTKVFALGDGLTYQWYEKNVGEEKFVKSSCKTEMYSCIMSEERHMRQVYCVIGDAYGNQVTTRTAVLRILGMIDPQYTTTTTTTKKPTITTTKKPTTTTTTTKETTTTTEETTTTTTTVPTLAPTTTEPTTVPTTAAVADPGERDGPDLWVVLAIAAALAAAAVLTVMLCRQKRG